MKYKVVIGEGVGEMVCTEASPLLVVRVVPEHSWEGLRDIPQPVWAAVDYRRAEV